MGSLTHLGLAQLVDVPARLPDHLLDAPLLAGLSLHVGLNPGTEKAVLPDSHKP